MGKYFILLVLGVIVVMGSLGWLVLGQEGNASRAIASINGRMQDEDDASLAKLSQPELLKIANDTMSKKRVAAILQLLEMDRDLPNLVPQLAVLLFDGDQLVKIGAGIVLKKIGAQGAEFVREMMESEDIAQNAIACSALFEMGGANLYSDKIKQWLQTDDSIARRRALFALQGSNEGVLELLEPIIGTLKDPDFNVQCMACRVITNLGPDAIDATSALVELHKTGLPSARSWAAVALGAIGPSTELDTAKFLAGTLDAFNQLEKQRSLLGLAKMGPEAISVADQVRETMRDRQKRVMPHAAFALWKITGETDEPLEVLRAGLNDPNETDTTLELVSQMQAAAEPLVDEIINIANLTDKDVESWREAAIIALGNIGPGAKAGLPALEQIANDKSLDAIIRFYAREAIDKISKKE